MDRKPDGMRPQRGVEGLRAVWLTSPEALHGVRVTVMGLGLFGGGAGVTRFLVDKGAAVTVTDLRPPGELTESLERLEGLPIDFVLGEHREADFRYPDLVIANPAVPQESPFLEVARDHGVAVESEINLTLRFLPTPYVVGVTGSNGKTTTSHLIHHMVTACGRRSFLGGNTGGSLLVDLDRIGAEDVVVLELSSFQLETTGPAGLGPKVAVLTNITPNHLDRHGTFENYIEAKEQILIGASAAVLNADNPHTARIAGALDPRMVTLFSSQRHLDRGFFLDGDNLLLHRDHQVDTLLHGDEVALLGTFNLENIMAALAATELILERDGVPPESIEAAARFPGVPHRLEPVARVRGVRYINDSIATTPESTIAALEALEGPTAVILGGYDKNLPFDRLAEVVRQRARLVCLIGATADKLARAIEHNHSSCDEGPELFRASSLERALELATGRAAEGWTVLLSPACASYDQFINFVQRGEAFRRWVRKKIPAH